jgi:hypothetical protein
LPVTEILPPLLTVRIPLTAIKIPEGKGSLPLKVNGPFNVKLLYCFGEEVIWVPPEGTVRSPSDPFPPRTWNPKTPIVPPPPAAST